MEGHTAEGFYGRGVEDVDEMGNRVNWLYNSQQADSTISFIDEFN